MSSARASRSARSIRAKHVTRFERDPELRIFLPEAEVPVLGDDDVIEDSNAQKLSGGLESAGDVTILLTRTRIAARMVVHEKHGRSRPPDRLSKDFPRMDQACRQRAHRNSLHRHHTMAPVEQHHMKGLAAPFSKAPTKVSLDVSRAFDSLPTFERTRHASASQFEGGNQARGLRRTDPGNLEQAAGSLLGKSSGSTETGQEEPRYLAGLSVRIAGPENQCNEIRIAEGGWTDSVQPFSRTLARIR